MLSKTEKTKHQLQSFYLKIIAPILIYLSLLLTVIGASMILIEKRPLFDILSGLGSFISGMLTITAILFATREYILIRAFNGAKEFRDFYVSTINPISLDFTNYYLINKGQLQANLKERDFDKLNDMQKKSIDDLHIDINLYLSKTISSINATYKDLEFQNKWLANKVESLFFSLNEELHHLFIANKEVHFYWLGNHELNRNQKYINIMLGQINDLDADFIEIEYDPVIKVRDIISQIERIDIY